MIPLVEAGIEALVALAERGAVKKVAKGVLKREVVSAAAEHAVSKATPKVSAKVAEKIAKAYQKANTAATTLRGAAGFVRETADTVEQVSNPVSLLRPVVKTPFGTPMPSDKDVMKESADAAREALRQAVNKDIRDTVKRRTREDPKLANRNLELQYVKRETRALEVFDKALSEQNLKKAANFAKAAGKALDDPMKILQAVTSRINKYWAHDKNYYQSSNPSYSKFAGVDVTIGDITPQRRGQIIRLVGEGMDVHDATRQVMESTAQVETLHRNKPILGTQALDLARKISQFNKSTYSPVKGSIVSKRQEKAFMERYFAPDMGEDGVQRTDTAGNLVYVDSDGNRWTINDARETLGELSQFRARRAAKPDYVLSRIQSSVKSTLAGHNLRVANLTKSLTSAGVKELFPRAFDAMVAAYNGMSPGELSFYIRTGIRYEKRQMASQPGFRKKSTEAIVIFSSDRYLILSHLRALLQELQIDPQSVGVDNVVI